MVILVVLTVAFVSAALAVRKRHDPDSRRTIVMRAVAESIGMNSLALSCSGAGARNPAEGAAGGLGDMPAGYCLDTACDVVTSPGPGARPFTFVRLRLGL